MPGEEAFRDPAPITQPGVPATPAPLQPPNGRAQRLDFPAPRATGARERLELCSREVHVGALSAEQKSYSPPTHVASLGIAFDVTLREV